MYKIDWHEGMLLLPQHFQQNDHYFERLISLSVNAKGKYPYGINELEICQEQLALGTIKIKKLKAFLSDGTYIDIPNKDPSPELLTLDKSQGTCIIYFCVPNNISEKLNRFNKKILNTNDKNNILDCPDLNILQLNSKLFAEYFYYS